jgi:hypothetical protein
MPPVGLAAGPQLMLLKARISTPVLCAMARYRDALKEAPNAGPDGQIVAQLPPGVHSSPPFTGLVMPCTLLTAAARRERRGVEELVTSVGGWM